MSKIKKLTTFQKVSLVFILVGLLNYIQGIIVAVTQKDWNLLIGKILSLAIMAIIVYLLKNRIFGGWKNLMKQRDATREQFERSKGNINIKDAAIFSLTWSREIYKNIPDDRKQLVKTSFILIGIAGGIIMFHLGRYGFLTMVVIAGLILAGVNLLIWVVGSERQEKDRLAIELETARKMQMSLMPSHAPEILGFDIAGTCIPAMNVGGDLFDFVWFGKNSHKLCIPIVDVSGKGMDAALTAVYTSGALVSEAQHEENVLTVVGNLNSAIYSRQNRSRFVSLLMVALDTDSHSIEYINAGQSQPLLARNNNVSILKGLGSRFPLGIVKTPQYLAQGLQLIKGDIMLLYTDGVTEAMNNKEEMYGEERLRILFLNLTYQGLTAAGIISEIKNEVLRFSGLEQQHDDLTLVAIKML